MVLVMYASPDLIEKVMESKQFDTVYTHGRHAVVDAQRRHAVNDLITCGAFGGCQGSIIRRPSLQQWKQPQLPAENIKLPHNNDAVRLQ